MGHTSAGLSLRHRPRNFSRPKSRQPEAYVRQRRSGTLFISSADYGSNLDALAAGKWIGNLQEGTYQKHHSAAVESQLKGLNIKYETKWSEGMVGEEIRHRVEAVNRWYQHDWGMIDNKIRSSIVEGISVFLSIFDLPDVARVSVPPAPAPRPPETEPINPDDPKQVKQPGLGKRVRQSLPPSMS